MEKYYVIGLSGSEIEHVLSQFTSEYSEILLRKSNENRNLSDRSGVTAYIRHLKAYSEGDETHKQDDNGHSSIEKIFGEYGSFLYISSDFYYTLIEHNVKINPLGTIEKNQLPGKLSLLIDMKYYSLKFI